MTTAVDLPFVVKICGITNEEDARVAVEAGANALGFNFYRNSPRYITPHRAREIAEAVPGTFLKVGVFVNASEEELLKTGREVPLDVVQLHGRCDLPPYRVWRSCGPEEYIEAPLPEAVLIDAPSEGFGGSGKVFDWNLVARYPYRAILAGGLDASNVAEAIRIVQPWGVDACSRLESVPGKKNPQRVREFIEAAFAASYEFHHST